MYQVVANCVETTVRPLEPEFQVIISWDCCASFLHRSSVDIIARMDNKLNRVLICGSPESIFHMYFCL